MSLLIFKNYQELVTTYNNYDISGLVSDGMEEAMSTDIEFILSTAVALEGLRIIHSDLCRSTKIIDLSRNEELQFTARDVENYVILTGGVSDEIKNKVLARFSVHGVCVEV